MTVDKKILEIKNLTSRLIYKPSIIESEFERKLEKQHHSLGEPYLTLKDTNRKGLVFYLIREVDTKGIKIIYKKGCYMKGKDLRGLIQDIDNPKHEVIRLIENGGYLVLDFHFISDKLVETLNAGNYETIKHIKNVYLNHFHDAKSKNPKTLLPEIKQSLKSKSIYDILDFIVYSIDYNREVKKITGGKG